MATLTNNLNYLSENIFAKNWQNVEKNYSWPYTIVRAKAFKNYTFDNHCEPLAQG